MIILWCIKQNHKAKVILEGNDLTVFFFTYKTSRKPRLFRLDVDMFNPRNALSFRGRAHLITICVLLFLTYTTRVEIVWMYLSGFLLFQDVSYQLPSWVDYDKRDKKVTSDHFQKVIRVKKKTRRTATVHGLYDLP